MDKYQGDLTDILRASCSTSTGGGGLGQSADGPGTTSAVSNWEFSSDPVLNNLSSSASGLEDNINSNRDDDNNNNHVFGDPFVNMRDPLLHELDVVASGCPAYFSSPNSTDHVVSSVDDSHSLSGASSSSNLLGRHHHDHHKVFEEDQINNNKNNSYDHSPCGIFSRIQISQNNSTKLPISPCDSSVIAAASPRGFKTSPMISIDMINANSPKNCLIDSSGAVQISSPRNLGIKRRKSQAKKVVCIPAPAAANSRASGEVVPSDLWAWRKYGQKPIKGSPYPRGYYRCSSSKGCSARKQVERSRTDPNMLVITYTSEHNHPWPTQRNALAGSTRSQPPKNGAAGSKSYHPQKTAPSTKEEHKESSDDTLSPSNKVAADGQPVKEEIDDVNGKHVMEMNDADLFTSEGFPSYRPMMSDPNQSEDFFSELGEIEADTLHLFLSQDAFSGHHEQKESKGLNSYGIFDWPADENNNNISFEEAKRGL